jgi:hypothetical protein
VQKIDSYIDQYGGVPPKRKKIKKLSWSLTGPTGEYALEDLPESRSLHEKIEFLTDRMQRDKIVSTERPIENTPRGVPDVPFVLEKMKATSMVIPRKNIPSELGISYFKIWISDPNPEHFTGEEWSFLGSFLYLTEMRFDNSGPHHFYSGCSALRIIANVASGIDLLDRSGVEKFGRWEPTHPIDKLSKIGGVKGDSKSILSLYQIRYMTDEQSYSTNGEERRVHDILGYPLFIAEI